MAHLPPDNRPQRKGVSADSIMRAPASLGGLAIISTSAPAVEVCPAASNRGRAVPASLLTKGMTLVRVERMQPFLDRYLYWEAAWLLGVGFSEGFRIPCSLASVPPVSQNLRSALQHPAVVSEKWRKELALGRMGGSFPWQP